jgi:alpha,alpha-trehalose phosphorylase
VLCHATEQSQMTLTCARTPTRPYTQKTLARSPSRSWMMLAYGFAGLRDYDGTLSFWPRRPPEANAIPRFPLTYRGQMLEVEIGPETATDALGEVERLVIRYETGAIPLTREQPRAVRPVSSW